MKALIDCHCEMVKIYGYGIQVDAALMLWHRWLKDRISSKETTGKNHFYFGSDRPSNPNATFTYRRTFKILINASSRTGETIVIHRTSVIALLYASWEDRHRKRIEVEAGLNDKSDLQSDVFGDVRMLRNAIMHANGALRYEPKVFRFFSKGEKVILTNQHLDTIFRAAVDELNRIAREYFSANPHFKFEKRLN